MSINPTLNRQTSDEFQPINPIALWILRVASVVAICLTAYLTFKSWRGGVVVGCDVGGMFDCQYVLSSKWAWWLGIPVSILGLLTYTMIFAFSWPVAARKGQRFQFIAWCAILVFALAAAGAALWFLFLQVYKLHTFCRYCMATHACGIAIGALMIWQFRRANPSLWLNRLRSPTEAPTATDAGVDGQSSVSNTAIFLTLSSLALIGLAVVAGGQILFPPSTLFVRIDWESGDDAPNGSASGNIIEGNASSTRAGGNPHIRTFAGNRVTLDISAQPMVGNPQADYVLVFGLSYLCEHCRRMHRSLDAARQRYGDQLAFVVCPIGAEKECNWLAKPNDSRLNWSCDFARAALAVWRTSPDKFAEFHEWAMGSEDFRSNFEVQRFADELVGTDVSQIVENDATIDQMLKGNVQLAVILARSVPFLAFSRGVFHGVPESDEALFTALEQQLGIKPE